MIEGKNIILRTVREEDLAQMMVLHSNLSEKGDYWPVLLPSPIKFQKNFRDTGLWDNDYGTMIITDKTGKLIGEIAFFKGIWYMEGYEVGYQLYRREDRGKGYMSEALKLFTAYLFALKPVQRLQLTVIVGNVASRRVAEKCGYKYEGRQRKIVFNRGNYHDLEIFSILREEVPALVDVL